MTRTIYLVEGSSGEYDGRREWVTGAYLTEEAAQRRIWELEDVLRILGLVREHSLWNNPSGYVSYETLIAFQQHQQGDPIASLDFPGVSYHFAPVTLHE